MNKQTKKLKIVVSVIGIVLILVLTSFAIVKNYQEEPTYTSSMRIRDVVRSRTTWNAAFTSWYGKVSPDFTVLDIEGRSHTLSDYRGRNMLAVFWATWCPACNLEIPHLIELRKMHGEKELAILAFSNESPELLKEFVTAQNINYAVVSLGSSTLPAPFTNVTSIPTTFIIDQNATIKHVAEGLVSLDEVTAIMQAEQ